MAWEFVAGLTQKQEAALSLLLECVIEASSGMSIYSVEEEREILLEAAQEAVNAFRVHLPLVHWVGGEPCGED